MFACTRLSTEIRGCDPCSLRSSYLPPVQVTNPVSKRFSEGKMQPNRLGLGLRPPLPSYGQGPSMSALAQQQQQMHFVQPQAQKQTNLFVGSISGGITDAFLNQLLSARIHVDFFF